MERDEDEQGGATQASEQPEEGGGHDQPAEGGRETVEAEERSSD